MTHGHRPHGASGSSWRSARGLCSVCVQLSAGEWELVWQGQTGEGAMVAEGNRISAWGSLGAQHWGAGSGLAPPTPAVPLFCDSSKTGTLVILKPSKEKPLFRGKMPSLFLASDQRQCIREIQKVHEMQN